MTCNTSKVRKKLEELIGEIGWEKSKASYEKWEGQWSHHSDRMYPMVYRNSASTGVE